jgi:EpsI family protein
MRSVAVRNRFFVVAFVLAIAVAVLRLDASAEKRINVPSLDELSVPNATILEDYRLDPETEHVLQADRYLLRSYASGGVPADVFVAFYASQQSGHTIHSPLNCMPGTGWTWSSRNQEDIRTSDGQTITVNRNVATHNGESLLVYYWYQSRGRVTASDYRNKLLLVQDALLLHRSDGALVRVTTPWPLDASQPSRPTTFVRDLYSALTRHLPE